MDAVLLALNPRHRHHGRFYQPLLEYLEISAHIQELPYSVHHVEFGQNGIVSCLDPLICQKFGQVGSDF